MASNENEILGSAAPVGKLKEIAAGRALNRRHFIAALGMTGAAAGAGMMSGCSTSTVAVTTASTAQLDMLNFALNVKYLTATFYSFITQGSDLTGAAVTNSGAVSGAPSAKLVFTGASAQQITDMLNEVYYDEKNHVSILLSLLGANAVFRPAINLASLGAITATNAISIARLLEDVIVTAYANLVTGLSSTDITLLGQILGADSYHAGNLRLTALQNPTIAAYIKADTLDVAPFDNGSTSSSGPTSSGAFFATAGATTSNLTTPAGFAFTRTVSQTFAILFGTSNGTSVTGASVGTTSGGFFPNGVNGNLNKV